MVHDVERILESVRRDAVKVRSTANEDALCASLRRYCGYDAGAAMRAYNLLTDVPVSGRGRSRALLGLLVESQRQERFFVDLLESLEGADLSGAIVRGVEPSELEALLESQLVSGGERDSRLREVIGVISQRLVARGGVLLSFEHKGAFWLRGVTAVCGPTADVLSLVSELAPTRALSASSSASSDP